MQTTLNQHIENTPGVCNGRPRVAGFAAAEVAGDRRRLEGPTRMYKKKIGPPVPYAIRGANWCLGESNSNDDVSKYAPSLEVYAASLAETFGQKQVSFFYTQPAGDGTTNYK